ncbi:MAG: TetR/AcrR family transcriptional regulator [Halanaerobium sp.]|nr:TetR/AcrR family transcriptional regulator [Halanaerobium sp.]
MDEEDRTRKQEIIDTARYIFLRQGYENTSVREIINVVGIAKGTFYYYFQSKRDLLEEVVSQVMNNIKTIYLDIIHQEELNALAKVALLIDTVNRWKSNNKDMVLFELILQERAEKGLAFWYQLRERAVADLVPALTCLLEEGSREGLFSVKYPEEMAEIIIHLIFDMKNIRQQVRESELRQEAGKVKMAAFIYCLERLLGTPEGAILAALQSTYDDW